MFYLVQRTEVWTLTWQGWLIVLPAFCLTICLGVIVGIRWIYPFLAVNRPLSKTEVAIVEGWIPDDVLKTMIPELQNYRLVITTGYAVNYGRYLSKYESFAEVAADTLILFGLSPDKVIPVSRSSAKRDRTLLSAFMVQDWLSQSEQEIYSLNLYSMGPHARRSWLLFRKALAPVKVGIRAVPPQDYEPHQWWLTSSGVRTVLAEAISYLYAILVSWAR